MTLKANQNDKKNCKRKAWLQILIVLKECKKSLKDLKTLKFLKTSNCKKDY